jgi:DNA modification methylase
MAKTKKTAHTVDLKLGQQLLHRSPDELKPYPGNARKHDEKQLVTLMASIREFGFNTVITTNEEGMVLAGHGRLEAAKRLGLSSVPTRVIEGLTKAQQRAYVLADNKTSLMSTWDSDQLRIELDQLVIDDFDIELTGFTTAEFDMMIDVEPPTEDDPADLQPEDVVEQIVSREGDLYHLGKHRLYCGSCLNNESYALVMDGNEAQMVITDPPYNVKISGHVTGNGAVQHDEFAMAAGEMSPGEFTDFLSTALGLVSEYSKDGAIIYSFMDWRHQIEMLSAAEPIFGSLKQLCIWVKDNGGMGQFYRSQHELVYVFKKGNDAHINNFGLGQNGRYRTNVWHYPGVNTFRGKGYELLKLHPTVKPVSMIADAIRDCSKRGGIVLDPFAGSGTILLAAERTGRHGRAIELEPKYVDTAIRRWQRVTGESALHPVTGLTFDELATSRNATKE